MSNKDWKTLSSEIIFSDPWIKLRCEFVEQPGVGIRPYSVIELKGGVGVVAINEQSQILMVGQYRHPVKRYSWEIPKGGFDDFVQSNRNPLATAKRELKEETGYIASEWNVLSIVHTLLGSTNDEVFLFCARNMVTGQRQPEKVEDLTVRWVSVKEFWEMVSKLDITDATSIAAVGICVRLGFLNCSVTE
jgi:8-oxo-dGTP pyrophosphatase MutT (NUDIX family)